MKKLVYLWMFFTQMTFGQEFQGKIIDAHTQNHLSEVKITLKAFDKYVLSDSLGFFQWIDPIDFPVSFVFEKDSYFLEELTIDSPENLQDFYTIILQKPQQTAFEQGILITDEELLEESDNSELSMVLLQSSRDIFEQMASFGWGQARFRFRMLENNHGVVIFNGLQINKLQDGRPQYANWGGLNDVLRSQEFYSGIRVFAHGFGGALGSLVLNPKVSNIARGTRVSVMGSNTNYNTRVMFTHNSGINKNGWGYVLSGSYRRADEAYFEGTDYDAKSLFASVEKQWNDQHSLYLTATWAMNKRGKNSVNTQEVIDLKGEKYNSFWGWQNGKKRNSRYRTVDEPMISLNYEWKISQTSQFEAHLGYQWGSIVHSRLDYSGVNNPDPTYYRNLPSYYLNLHNNYSDIPEWTPNHQRAAIARIFFLQNGQINWNKLYHANKINNQALYVLSADVNQDNTAFASVYYSGQLPSNFSFQSGVRYRKLYSENYRRIEDLLGDAPMIEPFSFYSGDYGISDLNQPNRTIHRGGKYGYHYAIHASDVTIFNNILFQKKKWNAFVGTQVVFNQFQREGFYKNGLFPNDSYGKGEAINFKNGGIKTGISYQIKGNQFVETNGFFYGKAPAIRNVYPNIRNYHGVLPQMQSEKIYGGDVSYIVKALNLKARITAYYNYTKDATRLNFFYADGIDLDEIDQYFVAESLQNISKEAAGVELGVEYPLSSTVKIYGAASLADSRYSDDADLQLHIDGRVLEGKEPLVDYGKAMIKNYKLGNTPHKAFSLGVEYRDPNFWWVVAQGHYFADSYIEIAPLLRTQQFFAQPNSGGMSFPEIDLDKAKHFLAQEKLPSVFSLSLQGGKSWRIKKHFVGVFISANNVFGKMYKTGGFEQSRAANYREMNKSTASGIATFGTRYFYAYGTTYFANLYWRF